MSNEKLAWCPYCSMPMTVCRIDKKGRPYVFCSGCGTRSFFKVERAWQGWQAISKRAGEEAEPKLTAIIKQNLERMASQSTIDPRARPLPAPEVSTTTEKKEEAQHAE
ncbi:MAG: hypothetical protein ACREIL_10440 [Nitrospiraceae bacterium]